MCFCRRGLLVSTVKNFIVLSVEREKNTFYFSLQMSDPFFVTGPHLPSLRTVCCCEHFWNSWAMTPDNSFTTLKVLKKNFWIARSVILLMIICLDSSWHNSPKECCSAGHSTVSFILSVFKSLEGGGCCRELKLRPKTSWLQLGGGGYQSKGMPPSCVSYYRVSPDLMGLTAISTITSSASCQRETGTCTADIWHIPSRWKWPTGW